MEGDGDRIAEGERPGPALPHGAVAVGQLDAAGAVPQELDDAAGGADFVGVAFLDRIHGIFRINTIGLSQAVIILILLILSKIARRGSSFRRDSRDFQD
jgi:hypothetical protein